MTERRYHTSAVSRRVLKVVSLFSGLQIFNILCSVVKMKLVAVWLHAVGVGLFGIYQTAIDTIATLTDLGLRQSTTRDVAKAANMPSMLARLAVVVRRWSVMSGLLGAVVISGFAPLLGKIFFGSPSHCWGFVILSASMFLNSVVNGEQALLQGVGQLRNLAKGSLWGSVAGLAVSIPMFYFLGEKSVVLSIVAYSVAVAGFTLLFRYRPQKKSESLGLKEIWNNGKGFARLGICIAIATFITNLSRMALLAVLTDMSDLATVGYFQAGDTLVTRYIGLVFTAVGVEFYPRLSAYASSDKRVRLFVNHEIQLILLALTPVILLFLLFRGVIVEILYTSDFSVILTFISLAAVGCIFKVLSSCMAFCIIARGEGKMYVLTEGVDAVIGLALCLTGYFFWGLAGIGAAYILWNISYALIVGMVYYRRYRLRLSQHVWKTVVFSLLTAIAGFVAVEWLPLWFSASFVGIAVLLFLHRLKRMM